MLSAATVALALVAQAANFGAEVRLFAFLVLPVVLVLGWATHLRLGDARGEDVWLVVGTNRLRHADLELAPELAPYFVTAHHDDEAGIRQIYGYSFVRTGGVPPSRVLASTPALVGVINAVVAGVLAGLAVEALGMPTAIYVADGAATGLVSAGHTRRRTNCQTVGTATGNANTN